METPRATEAQTAGTVAPVSPVDRKLAEMFAGSQPFEVDTTPRTLYVVSIKDGARIVQQFEVMGASRVAVQKAHEGLCTGQQYCWVETRAERDEAAIVRAAMLREIDRPGEMLRAMGWDRA